MVALQSIPLCLRKGVGDAFKTNCCSIAIPGPGDEAPTKDGDRIRPNNIRNMVVTWITMVAVREKAARAAGGIASPPLASAR